MGKNDLFSQLHRFGIMVICHAPQWNMKDIFGHNSNNKSKQKIKRYKIIKIIILLLGINRP